MEIYLASFLLVLIFSGQSKCFYLSKIGNWSYNGDTAPDNWKNLNTEHNECGGLNQSPIDVSTKDFQISTRRLSIVNHDQIFQQSLLVNNGQNVHLVLQNYNLKEEPLLQITKQNGSILRFKFNSLHFHFGSKNDLGSEHYLDGQSFPMEMHAVYFDPQFGNISEAMKRSFGIVKVAVLYKVSADEHNLNALVNLTAKLTEVRRPETKTVIPEIRLRNMFPYDIDRYYKYEGSLTIPPCSHPVRWYILRERVPVTECQLDKFRQLIRSPIDGDEDKINYIADNIRPLQPLNGRAVFGRS